jgi:hypothetical protein
VSRPAGRLTKHQTELLERMRGAGGALEVERPTFPYGIKDGIRVSVWRSLQRLGYLRSKRTTRGRFLLTLVKETSP